MDKLIERLRGRRTSMVTVMNGTDWDLLKEAADRIEALEVAAVAPVAEVVAGNYMNRLMWATDEMQENTPVGTKLYAAPLVQPVLNGQVIDKTVLKRLVVQVFGDGFEIQLAAPQVAWMPIDTAPKEGTCLVCSEGIVGEARYFEEERGWWWEGTHPTDATGGDVWNPTHWMPLPAPPTVEVGDQT
jgi:hypothetical protein